MTRNPPKLASLSVALAALCVAGGAVAKLPPPSDAQKIKADEARARVAWTDKVAAYQLCRAQDKVAAHYQGDLKARGKPVPPATAGAPCADPGPFAMPAPTADASKIAGGPGTAPVATPSDHKPAAAPAGQAVQSPRQSP